MLCFLRAVSVQTRHQILSVRIVNDFASYSCWGLCCARHEEQYFPQVLAPYGSHFLLVTCFDNSSFNALILCVLAWCCRDSGASGAFRGVFVVRAGVCLELICQPPRPRPRCAPAVWGTNTVQSPGTNSGLGPGLQFLPKASTATLPCAWAPVPRHSGLWHLRATRGPGRRPGALAVARALAAARGPGSCQGLWRRRGAIVSARLPSGR